MSHNLTAGAIYTRIGEAIAFYQGRGYEYRDVPWLISEEADDITRPEHKAPIEVDGMLRLPASGEQGFLHLLLRGDLPNGRYVTVSPCFRHEPAYTEIHRPWFLKVELIAVGEDATADLIKDAKDFLSRYVPVQEVPTPGGVDLEHRGLELGSYGVRHLRSWCWTFGTGLAEPRLSVAMERYARSGAGSSSEGPE